MTINQILNQHFFRRFFDNDTLSGEGETETAVIRALALCAVPALMVAFWLLPSYPSRNIPGVIFVGRDPWAIAADRYFFVLYSFFVMGTVATFEWQMLFPDRADFLILLPLPLKPRQLFLAKGRALLTFLGMFLIAANIFALIFYSAISTRAQDSYLHTVIAHFSAVMLAGIFAAFTMLAIAGLALCLLPSSWFQTFSTILQCLSIAALLLLFLLFPLAGSHMKMLLTGQAPIAQFIPPLWFLGLYVHLVQGAQAPAAAATLAQTGLYATALSVVVAIVTYPLAWARQKKRALEGASEARGQHSNPIASLLHKTILRQPQARAVFHFIHQTITRNTKYQVYLALYAGAGLALALCSIVTVHQVKNGPLTPALSIPGLHAILPLLLFWMILGLRAAFAFPIDMRARWVFPMNLPYSPLAIQAARSAKLWTLLCCSLLTTAILAFLLALHWPWLNLAIQLLFGASLSLLLADLTFIGRTQIAFTRPRLPGRSSLPIVFVIYAALFPATILGAIKAEQSAERNPIQILWIIGLTAALHLLLKATDQLAQKGIIGGFPEDESDEGPQTLGLIPSTQR